MADNISRTRTAAEAKPAKENLLAAGAAEKALELLKNK